MTVSLSDHSSRLWVCHEHEMIGNQQEAHGHRQAHGCEVVELDQATSDAVREEWRKQVTFWDPAIAAAVLTGPLGKEDQ